MSKSHKISDLRASEFRQHRLSQTPFRLDSIFLGSLVQCSPASSLLERFFPEFDTRSGNKEATAVLSAPIAAQQVMLYGQAFG